MKGLFPWLREMLFGPASAHCRRWDHCTSLPLHECGSGNCAEHHILYCKDFDGVFRCKKPPPKLSVVLGMRR